jgi:hypothetical protein
MGFNDIGDALICEALANVAALADGPKPVVAGTRSQRYSRCSEQKRTGTPLGLWRKRWYRYHGERCFSGAPPLP